jgi:hypothetical protein
MGSTRVFALVLSVSLASCGGQKHSATTTDKPSLYLCQPFTSCHDGNVVGRWRLSHVCLDEDYVKVSTSCGDAENSSSVTEITAYDASGTLEIDADGTATLETDELAYTRSTHPAACSSDPTAANTYCDAQRAAGANCSLTDGSCDCTSTTETMWPTPTSTYHPGDTTLFGMDFCVNGAGLTLRNAPVAGSGGDYVFVPE